MTDLYDQLRSKFCPPLYEALAAAICSDSDQTLQSATEVLNTLAEEARRQPQSYLHSSLPAPDRQGYSSDSSAANITPTEHHLTPDSPNTCAKGHHRQRRGKAALSDKLKVAAQPPREVKDASNTPKETVSLHLASEESSASELCVKQVLDEWARQQSQGRSAQGRDAHSHLDNELLNLTDEEEDVGKPAKADPSDLVVSGLDEDVAPLTFLQHAFPARTPEFLTGILFGDCDGNISLALDTLITIDLAEAEEAEFASSATILSRSELHLNVAAGTGSSILSSSIGDLSDLTGSTRAEDVQDGGLKDDVLQFGDEKASLKGKKSKAARKRLQEDQRRLKAGLPALGRGIGATPAMTNVSVKNHGGGHAGGQHAASRRAQQVKINLTDVRHGGAVKDQRFKKVSSNSTSSPLVNGRQSKFAINGGVAEGERGDEALFGETDEEYARRLAQIERERTRDPDDDKAVNDNRWLLASSVLAQLSTLLNMDMSKVTAAYNSADFNLVHAFNRLVHATAEQNAPLGLASLDAAPPSKGAPVEAANHSISIAEGIATLTGTSFAHASKAFCATKGRQDAAIDLIQLQAVVQSAMLDNSSSLLDVMDPLGRLTIRSDASSGVTGYTAVAASSEGRFSRGEQYYLKPGESGAGGHAAWSGGSGSGYAGAASRPLSVRQRAAAQAAAKLASDAVVLPASAARVCTAAEEEAEWRLASSRAGKSSNAGTGLAYSDSRLMANEYRARRAEALRSAAAAWRSGIGAQARSGVAWYYADEARRLDAKARAWSMRAAQALVEERRAHRLGVESGRHRSAADADGGFAAGRARDNTIDLHDLTVHEALSVTKECVNEWYSRPSHVSSGLAYLGPLHVITGVGRHSPRNIAVIKPAVIKMLDREGWKYDVDHHRGVITVRGVK
ncbi:hypothetical protein K437DRAFT_71417 [Tilletiaria anomala UBC 951]|uniref:Smr domain-containing protein n=1 Tax=Tilletiaria anomala (strain ATCC 24038 / CBS 436.72 / UBC 951) TaxID=1037660 RepID=A0A066WHG7_TILAU|nr:uncharacterized protein K437DRAFT_71417 [Tilletiaria anomala UBC 951]KDN53427.1 hypothetical protein K437DRAFT_71417 [Tilletiaria anomala UBC 951]